MEHPYEPKKSVPPPPEEEFKVTSIFSETHCPHVLSIIHSSRYNPVHPTLSKDWWDIVYAFNEGLQGTLENLGDAVLRFCLAQLARKVIPEGHMLYSGVSRLCLHYHIVMETQEISASINSNLVFGNIAQRLGLHTYTRSPENIQPLKQVFVKPPKSFANTFETMVGAYLCQEGFDAVMVWVEQTFTILLYGAELDARYNMGRKKGRKLMLTTVLPEWITNPKTRSQKVLASMSGAPQPSVLDFLDPPARHDDNDTMPSGGQRKRRKLEQE